MDKIRNFNIRFYTETESYDSRFVLSHLLSISENSWYIIHDSDGNKPHIHFCGILSGGRSLDWICQQIGIDVSENGQSFNLERMNSKKYSLRYLIHADHKAKHQYDVSSVVCSAIDRKTLLDICSDSVSLSDSEMWEFIKRHKDSICTIEDLLSVGFENGNANFIRQYAYLLCKYLKL